MDGWIRTLVHDLQGTLSLKTDQRALVPPPCQRQRFGQCYLVENFSSRAVVCVHSCGLLPHEDPPLWCRLCCAGNRAPVRAGVYPIVTFSRLSLMLYNFLLQKPEMVGFDFKTNNTFSLKNF